MIGLRAHRRTALAVIVPAALLVSAASASGQQQAPPAPPAPPTPPPAAPVAAKLRVSTLRTPNGEALKGDRWVARVTLTPAVPGTKAEVSFTARGKRRTRTVTLKPSKTGKQAVGRLGYSNRSASRVVVRARIGKQQPAAPTRSKARVVVQGTPSVRPGARGPAVRILQSMLRAKGYYIGAPGVFDARTQRAVLAFRKVAGMSKTQQANGAVFGALRAGKGTFRVHFPQHGRHVEGDIDRQVLALIGKGGKVERIYTTSPGAPATPTIRGSFRVYMKDPGTNAKGMYKSSYFIRGYAVHGYPSVPNYNASHGCFRVPMSDAPYIYAWMTMGTPVDTY